MGMRQNIEFDYGEGKKVYFYSHWLGGDKNTSPLAQELREALAKRWRWNDPSYLVRVIISYILKDDIDGETGYGIAPYQIDDEFPNIEVDLENQTVNGMSYEEFIDYMPEE